MNPFGNMMGQSEGTNLFSILLNIAFGFVGGLMLFLGPKETIDLGTRYATQLLEMTGSGQGMYGFANFAPYIIITPIAGLVVKELSSVRSIKSFAFFAGAVLIGLVIAFFTEGSFV